MAAAQYRAVLRQRSSEIAHERYKSQKIHKLIASDARVCELASICGPFIVCTRFDLINKFLHSILHLWSARMRRNAAIAYPAI